MTIYKAISRRYFVYILHYYFNILLSLSFSVLPLVFILVFFFFNDTATPEIYTLSLHDALPIWNDLPGTGPQRSGASEARESIGYKLSLPAEPRRGCRSRIRDAFWGTQAPICRGRQVKQIGRAHV